MSNFSISSEIFEKLPDLKVMTVMTYGLDQKHLPTEILEKIHKEQTKLCNKLSNYQNYKNFPVIKA